MIPGRASAALILNRPSSNAKALSLDLIHSFRPASSLGGPPDATAPPPQQCFNEHTDSHSDSCEYGSNHNSMLFKQSLDLLSQ